MSPAQKCRKIGYVNSAVCKFEFQAPQKAQQVIAFHWINNYIGDRNLADKCTCYVT